MKEIHKRFLKKTDQVAFISITVDPETDTPEVLRAFMAKNGFDYPNWHCLTGTKEEVYQVVRKNARSCSGEREDVANAPVPMTSPTWAIWPFLISAAL